MAIAHVQDVVNAPAGSGVASSYTVTISTTKGNALLLGFTAYTNPSAAFTVTAVTDSAGNSWDFALNTPQTLPPSSTLVDSGTQELTGIACCLNSGQPNGVVQAVTSVTIGFSSGNVATPGSYFVVSEFSGVPSNAVMFAGVNESVQKTGVNYTTPSIRSVSGNPAIFYGTSDPANTLFNSASAPFTQISGSSVAWAITSGLQSITYNGTSSQNNDGSSLAVIDTNGYTLFGGTFPVGSGGSANTGQSADIGIQFQVNQPGYQLCGYWAFPTTSGTTTGSSHSFKLWSTTTGTSGSTVAGSSVTGSGTWLLNSWIYTPLTRPVTLPVGTYVAVWTMPTTVVQAFSLFWSTSGDGAQGIYKGPLFAPGTPAVLGGSQQPFNQPSTGGFPTSVFQNTLYMMDVQVNPIPAAQPLGHVSPGFMVTIPSSAGWRNAGHSR